MPNFTLSCSAWLQAPGCHCCPGVRTCRYLSACPAKIFFGMCQTTLLVFAGGVGLYLYYIVILGRVAVPCLFSPCFFSLFSLFGIQRLSMAGERLINILPAAPGRVLGAGVVFLVRPLCCIVTGAELRALRRRSGSSFGHLTSMIYLPQRCSWGCSLLFRTCLAK